MKKRKENYLVKGEYTRFQPRGFLAVKQYMFIEQNEKRCLLLRFENEMSLTITEAEISVTQLDAQGNEIGENIDIRYDGISIEAGRTFSTERGIVVDDSCADCRVQVRYVICGNMKYDVKNGQVTGHYDKRGYEADDILKTSAKKRSSKIKCRYKGGGKFYKLVAIVSLLLVIFALLFVKDRLEKADENDNFRNSRTALAAAWSADTNI